MSRERLPEKLRTLESPAWFSCRKFKKELRI
jgi:hypothetical protein